MERIIVEDDEVAPIVDELGDLVNGGYNGQRYVMTINNPASNPLVAGIGDNAGFGTWFNNRIPIRGMYWSLERGDSGTPHYQCYFELPKKMKLQALKNKVRSIGAWVAPAKGTADQSKDYIFHEGTHSDKSGLIAGGFTYGEFSVSQGTRSDIKALVVAIKAGHGIKRIAQEHTESCLRYLPNIQRLQGILGTARRHWFTELYIYTGKAGTGKSYSAHREAEAYIKELGLDEEPYDMMIPNSKNDKVWFQGYTGQAVVILDDFYGTIGIDWFKRFIDE